MELASLIEKPRVKNVYLKECGCRNPQEGDLTLVGHHLVFIPNLLNPTSVQNGELWLLYRAVDKVEVSITTKSNKTNDSKVELALLTLKCKNFLILVFQFTDIDDCEAVARAIEKLSNIDDIKLYYSYYYKCPFTVLDDGWLSYNVEEQFAKLLLKSGNKFRISTVNQNYSMCSSYPEKVIVPISNEDINLKISSTYRAEGRFPILAYYHQPKNVPIAISSQPLVGPLWRKCTEDENIVNSYLFGNGFGVIFDTRTKNLATLSRSRGGGVETNQNYSQYKYLHGKVPRIKEIKDSLRKLVALCQENDCGPDRWVRKLNDSGWLQSVSDSITAAATVAQIVDCEGKPVLIHGENGTDSTLLTASLAELLLDASSRSILGFQSLIEKIWIMGGHPFSLRCAHSAFENGSNTAKYEAPVFVLFLDSVWQLMRQFPLSFEFNEDFLLLLFEHIYASEFGCFIGNNEKEKSMHNVKESTISLWSFSNHPHILLNYINLMYEPYRYTLWPSVAPQAILLWDRLFMRWKKNWYEIDEVTKMAGQIKLQAKNYSNK